MSLIQRSKDPISESLTIGTRGSDLAMYQSCYVKELLLQQFPQMEIDLKVITTKGDVSLKEKLQGSLEKGFFTEELEKELLDGSIDIAVHSLKDVPTILRKELKLGAILQREHICDWLIVRPDAIDKDILDSHQLSILPLKENSNIGTSSIRREMLIEHFSNNLKYLPLRGNVPTRVQKLKDAHYDAIILAKAGLIRLNIDLGDFIVFELNPKKWQVAPGQGAICVQIRSHDEKTEEKVKSLNDEKTSDAVKWERSFLQILEGGCSTPFGSYVDSQVAYLGLSFEKSWISHIVKLPSLSFDEKHSDWVAQIIHEMQNKVTLKKTGKNYEHNNEWLYKIQSQKQ